jgi:hypothetical protein
VANLPTVLRIKTVFVLNIELVVIRSAAPVFVEELRLIVANGNAKPSPGSVTQACEVDRVRIRRSRVVELSVVTVLIAPIIVTAKVVPTVMRSAAAARSCCCPARARCGTRRQTPCVSSFDPCKRQYWPYSCYVLAVSQ